MASYRDVVNDDYGRPISGVLVYVFDKDGALAALNAGQANPITTDSLGAFSFDAPDAVYTLEFRFAGVTRRLDNILVGSPAEFVGATGPADNTYTDLAAFKASPISRKTASLVDIPGVPDGRANWTLGNFVGQADDVNIFKSDSESLATGAWVLQQSTGITHRAGETAPRRQLVRVLEDWSHNIRASGARVNGIDDDTAAAQDALNRNKAVFIDGRTRIDGVLNIPHGAMIHGSGPQNANISCGPAGQLRMEGLGWVANGDGGYDLHEDGCLTIRDLVISTIDALPDPLIPTIDFRKARDIEFSNVWLYHTLVKLDCFRNISFRKAKFFGGQANSRVEARCTYQRPNNPLNWISESLLFDDCTLSANPVDLWDTVSPIFSNIRMLAGPRGITSRVQYATGDENAPFLMGPVIRGSTLDSIEGLSIDIERGGTDCRIVDTFVSGGRGSAAAGIRLRDCIGVAVVASHIEWCGQHGVIVDGCDLTEFVGTAFLNQANGDAIRVLNSQRGKVVGCDIYNRPLFGGSAEGNTQLAINSPASDAEGWVVIGTNIGNMKGPRQTFLAATALPNPDMRVPNIIRFCPGLPYSEEIGFKLVNAATLPAFSAAPIGSEAYHTDTHKPVWSDGTGVVRYADGVAA